MFYLLHYDIVKKKQKRKKSGMIQLTNRQARQFLLLKQGLLGEYLFIGKQGAYDFVRQAGCIQFDPVDACSKNAELTLQSRVKGFTKKTLYELLYEDRLLVDYPDRIFRFFRRRTGLILNVTAGRRGKAAESSRNFPNWKNRRNGIFRRMERPAPTTCR